MKVLLESMAHWKRAVCWAGLLVMVGSTKMIIRAVLGFYGEKRALSNDFCKLGKRNGCTNNTKQ